MAERSTLIEDGRYWERRRRAAELMAAPEPSEPAESEPAEAAA